jgi:Flp pilus assembly protein TadB
MVTYDQFWKAYNNHPPNWLIRNYWRFFSKDTIKTDKWAKTLFIILTLILFGIGYFSTVFKFDKIYVAIPTYVYCGLLAFVVLPGFIAGKMNQRRTKKIAKELNVSLEEYNILVNMYWKK